MPLSDASAPYFVVHETAPFEPLFLAESDESSPEKYYDMKGWTNVAQRLYRTYGLLE